MEDAKPEGAKIDAVTKFARATAAKIIETTRAHAEAVKGAVVLAVAVGVGWLAGRRRR